MTVLCVSTTPKINRGGGGQDFILLVGRELGHIKKDCLLKQKLKQKKTPITEELEWKAVVPASNLAKKAIKPPPK